MDSFRKPRPDVPILPAKAIFRPVSKKRKVIRPKGRRGRKPKGRPKTTQADFITEAEARARVTRETGLRQLQLEQSEKSIKNERERLRLQGAVAQEEVRYRQLLIDREDRQRREDQDFRFRQEVRGQQFQQFLIGEQQQREDRLRAQQLAVEDRRRAEDLGFRQQQLAVEERRIGEEREFRQRQLGERALETARQDRILQDQQQFFRESLQREERRTGENQARLEGFLRELATQRAQPQVIRFREAQPEEDIRSPLSEVGVPTPSPRKAGATQRARDFARGTVAGGGSVRLSLSPEQRAQNIAQVERDIEAQPETATGRLRPPLEQLVEELEAGSPDSGLEQQSSPESLGTLQRRVAAAGRRVQAVARVVSRKPQTPPVEQGTEEERTGLLTEDPVLLQKLEEQTGIGTFTGVASPSLVARKDQTIPPVITAQQVIQQVEQQPRPEPEPQPELEPEPEPLATQVGGAVAGAVGATAGVVSNVGLGVVRGVAEQLPTAEGVGQAIGSGAVKVAGAVGSAALGAGQAAAEAVFGGDEFTPIDFEQDINPIRKSGKKITVDNLFIEVVSDVNKNLKAGKKFAVRSVPSITGTGKGNTTKFNFFKEGFSKRGEPQFTADDAVIQRALQEGKIRFSMKK